MSKIFDILYYYYKNTIHKIRVAYFLSIVIRRLFKRAFLHDVSKYRFSEAYKMSKVARKAKKMEFVSEEYLRCLASVEDVIKLHYCRNSHHPQHYGDYRNMTLIDLIEMYLDWKAAVKNNINGNFEKNVAILQKKFQMSDEIIGFLKTLG